MALSARDAKALLPLVEKTQVVYLVTRYPKKRVLRDPVDVGRLEQGLAEMRAAARDLSPRLREDHAVVRWDELERTPDTPDLAWRVAKRVAPTIIRELVPLLEGLPEAAFFLRPQPTQKKNARPAGTKTKVASAKGARQSAGHARR